MAILADVKEPYRVSPFYVGYLFGWAHAISSMDDCPYTTLGDRSLWYDGRFTAGRDRRLAHTKIVPKGGPI